MTDKAFHFIGISGIGMSSLARIALARGIAVSGSSDKESEITRKLVAEGAVVTIGHRPENIVGTPCVVVTSAVKADNSELQAARSAGLRILGRGEFLAEIFNVKRGIAIAGTHGKTTVTGMTATMLEEAQFDPTVAIGGLRRESGTNFRCGQSAWFVTESDESDGSFLHLRPEIAVVLNLENDHITSDDGMTKLREQFRTFLSYVPPQGIKIIGIDDVESAALAKETPAQQLRTFGFSADAWIRGANVRADGLGSRCTIFENNKELGELHLIVPGAINIANALAAIALGRYLEIPFVTIAKALATFGGVRRRFDILTQSERMVVVDDYAHHPTAVAATIAAARAVYSGPIVVAFQAHRYTRTAYLGHDFATSLEGADLILLPEIYAASELPIAGIDEHIIGDPLIAAGKNVRFIARKNMVAEVLQAAPKGAMVLMLGAGDITNAAHELAEAVDATVKHDLLVAHSA
jgi:UDP-N-acetylmuramate--alanine ligase